MGDPCEVASFCRTAGKSQHPEGADFSQKGKGRKSAPVTWLQLSDLGWDAEPLAGGLATCPVLSPCHSGCAGVCCPQSWFCSPDWWRLLCWSDQCCCRGLSLPLPCPGLLWFCVRRWERPSWRALWACCMGRDGERSRHAVTICPSHRSVPAALPPAAPAATSPAAAPGTQSSSVTPVCHINHSVLFWMSVVALTLLVCRGRTLGPGPVLAERSQADFHLLLLGRLLGEAGCLLLSSSVCVIPEPGAASQCWAVCWSPGWDP